MPLYEYECRECGNRLESRQKFADDPLTDCPTCGATDSLFRVVHAAGVVFKGSGFYITDSRGNRESLTSPGKKKEDSATSSASDNGSKDKSTDSGSTKSSSEKAKSPATKTT